MKIGKRNENPQSKGKIITSWGKFIDEVDKECKRDFNNNMIAGERDYLSCFSILIRKPSLIFNLAIDTKNFGSCLSYTLPRNLESEFGADNVIVFLFEKSKTKYAKIVLVEGKMIRESRLSNWDYAQSDTNKSHFINQLQRQMKYIDSGLFFLEMFMHDFQKSENKEVQNIPFSYPKNLEGSDFVRLDKISGWIISQYENKSSLIDSDYFRIIEYAEPISGIIDEIVKCNIGKKLPIEEDKGSTFIKLKTTEQKDILFPLPKEVFSSNRSKMKNENKFIEKLEAFMEEFGISTYTIIPV